MLFALVLALFASLAEPYQVAPQPASRPTISFITYPTTVKQLFVFRVQSPQTERIHAQLWALNRRQEWVCINYDISHPERADVMIQACGVVVQKGQFHTLRYALTDFDLFFLRDRKCVVNKRVNVKIVVKSCSGTTWGRRKYGESEETAIYGL